MELVANVGSAKPLAWEAGPNRIHGGRRRPGCRVRNVSKSFWENNVFNVCQSCVINKVDYPSLLSSLVGELRRIHEVIKDDLTKKPADRAELSSCVPLALGSRNFRLPSQSLSFKRLPPSDFLLGKS